MPNDFPSSDDPFNIICTFSPDHLYYYLYDVDLMGMKRLTQFDLDLVPHDDLNIKVKFPADLLGKVMYYVIESYIRDRDPGNALEYAYLCRSSLRDVYYKMFGRYNGTRRDKTVYLTMIRRIAQTFRCLYKIVDQMEAIDDPIHTHRIPIGLIHPYYQCFYNEYYDCAIFPYLLEIGTRKNEDYPPSWKLMVPEDGHVGAANTPWCRGHESQGIWRVYELAWPLVTLAFYFDEKRLDESSFKEFYRLIKSMFGKYTVIEKE